MPTPKTYNYTTNDVVMVPGVKRLFFDFRDESGLFVPSFRENNVCYASLARKRYTAIKERCKPNSRDYGGAENHFSDFQEFAEWMVGQTFYGLPEYSVDKDLFYDGGVLRYSKDTCCLIPDCLNSNLRDYKDDYTNYEKQRNKFICKIRFTPFGGDRVQKFIGRFDTAEECSEVYRINKTEIIRGVIAESYKDHVDERVYQKLKEWTPKLSRA
jgi:hypothetical protein